MAGDWIKIETCLPDKPEVFQISEVLDLDPDAVVGKLFRVFSWFDSHTENGNAPRVTEKIINRVAGVTGFCDAMIMAGWMDRNDQEIWLNKFERHNGKPAKTRAQTAKRVAKSRNAGGVTSALPEKRREENKPNKSPSTRRRSMHDDLTDTSWAKSGDQNHGR